MCVKKSGTIAPLDDGRGAGNLNTRIRLPAWMPDWLDLNFMVPLIATVIVVAVGILVVCVALSRRRADDLRGGQKDVYCRFCSFLCLSVYSKMLYWIIISITKFILYFYFLYRKYWFSYFISVLKYSNKKLIFTAKLLKLGA